MEKIKKYLKMSGVLNLIVMGVTLFASLYVFLIEHRLISKYLETLQGEDKFGAGLGLGFLLIFFIIAAVVMLAFALGQLIVGLIVLTSSNRNEFKRTPIPGVVAGAVLMLLSAACFAFLCLFSFDMDGISVISRIVYGVGLLVCVGGAIASIVCSALIRNEEVALREGESNEFFYG